MFFVLVNIPFYVLCPPIYLPKNNWKVGRWLSDAVHDTTLPLNKLPSLHSSQRICEKTDAGSVTQWMIFISLFFLCRYPFYYQSMLPQMSRVLRLLELSHSSNHVNDGRPIAAHPSSGPLPPLGPLSSPLSPSLPARCPPFLFYPNIYLLAIISFCFF